MSDKNLTPDEYHCTVVETVDDAFVSEMDEHDRYQGSVEILRIVKSEFVGSAHELAKIRVKPNPDTTNDDSPYVAIVYDVGEDDECIVYCDRYVVADHCFVGCVDGAEDAIRHIKNSEAAQYVEIDGKSWFLNQLE